MGEERNLGLVDRTLENLRNAWRDIRGSARVATTGTVRAELPPEDAERLKKQMVACLEARGGEVSARARAADLGRAYLSLDEQGRRRFLEILAREFGTNRAAVEKAIKDFHKAADGEERVLAQARLREALVSPRVKLLTQFTALPNGVKFLVDMRGEVLSLVRSDPDLAALEADLKRLFETWFDVGFLDLARIAWDSPAALLEKLIAYEAVHEIDSWDALKKRFDSDRRCFAFFHPRMPGEPVIFVEVALVEGMASNIQDLLDADAPALDPKRADSAIFYSISNAQKGLASISFGSFLIKQVIDDLAREFEGLKTFATLSPIPGFRAWLSKRLDVQDGELLEGIDLKPLLRLTGANEPGAAVMRALDSAWQSDEALAATLKGPLMRLCAHYLVREKSDGGALDPVARFHLRNGARIERINWLADTSAKGTAQSAGMMVNYNYRLAEIEDNHEAYVAEGRVATSTAVKGLLKGEGLARWTGRA